MSATATLMAGLTATATAETADPECHTFGKAKVCTYKDGRQTTEYLDQSAEDSKQGPNGPGGGAPAPRCYDVTDGPVAMCACTAGGLTVFTEGKCQIIVTSKEIPIVDVVGTVTRAAATLRLPDGTPQVAPDPQANEWKCSWSTSTSG